MDGSGSAARVKKLCRAVRLENKQTLTCIMADKRYQQRLAEMAQELPRLPEPGAGRREPRPCGLGVIGSRVQARAQSLTSFPSSSIPCSRRRTVNPTAPSSRRTSSQTGESFAPVLPWGYGHSGGVVSQAQSFIRRAAGGR